MVEHQGKKSRPFKFTILSSCLLDWEFMRNIGYNLVLKNSFEILCCVRNHRQGVSHHKSLLIEVLLQWTFGLKLKCFLFSLKIIARYPNSFIFLPPPLFSKLLKERLFRSWENLVKCQVTGNSRWTEFFSGTFLNKFSVKNCVSVPNSHDIILFNWSNQMTNQMVNHTKIFATERSSA